MLAKIAQKPLRVPGDADVDGTRTMRSHEQEREKRKMQQSIRVNKEETQKKEIGREARMS
jgi:hypothetical protein